MYCIRTHAFKTANTKVLAIGHNSELIPPTPNVIVEETHSVSHPANLLASESVSQ